MLKNILLTISFLLAINACYAQEGFTVKGDTLKRTPAPADTAKYVNPGKLAGRKAIFRSAVLPGWGQYGNGLNVYRGIKIAAIYAGGAVLVMSYMDNNRQYKVYLKELQYRLENNNNADPDGSLQRYTTEGLRAAKDIYRRNREVVIFSIGALYAVNIIEAYVDARLKYFDIGNNLALKISPTVISSGSMYGYNNSFAPAFKLAIRL